MGLGKLPGGLWVDTYSDKDFEISRRPRLINGMLQNKYVGNREKKSLGGKSEKKSRD